MMYIGIKYANNTYQRNIFYFLDIISLVCINALIFYYCDVYFDKHSDKEEDPESPRVLRHVELIDDEAAEYGIKIVRMKDRLMAKKYGFRNPPGITYFRKGKSINYDGDIDDEEEILDWLTNPENMELTDHIERINNKMFQKVRQTTDYLAVFFCEYNMIACRKIAQMDLYFLIRRMSVQTATTANSAAEYWRRSSTLTMRLTEPASSS